MSRSSVRAIVVLLVVSLGFTALILTVPQARAATWTQDSDTDFNAGTFNHATVVGTGPSATVQLSKDATDWSNDGPVAPPSAREASIMAYDSANNVDILFGGYNGSYLGDTWSYAPDTSTWTLKSTTGPSGRELAAMTYDSVNNVMVLFGGVNSIIGFLNDTWEYSTAANTWVQFNPVPSPPTMESYHLTFDSASGVQRSILAGRNTVNGQMVTWAYNAATHTWQNKNPAPNLPTRVSFAMEYSPDIDMVVQFGGINPSPPPGTLQSTTYEYNWTANGWTLSSASGPAARTSAGFSYRSSTSSLYMFGGQGSGSALSDTWRYYNNPATGSRAWSPQSTQNSPTARSSFGLANQASGGKSVLFGGVQNGGLRANDTWSFGPAYQVQGSWTSQVFDSGGANVVWNNITWNAVTPPNTQVAFQIAVSNDPNGPWTFQGPGCAGAQYFLVSGASISACFSDFRYLRVTLRLITFNDSITPALDSVTIDYTVAPMAPYIVTQSPGNTEGGVSQTQSIFVRFSEAINTGSLQYTITPAITTTDTWSENNSAVTIGHATPFAECKAITVRITQALDLSGNNLVSNPFDPNIFNPWTFVTACVHPFIAATNPSQGQVDVALTAPIVVDFSENMNTTSVSWTITPSVSGVSGAWSNGTQRLTLSHTTAFTQCQVYQVQVAGDDLAGLALISGPAPNPWSFQAHCTFPYIVTTIPADQQTAVPTTQDVIIQFSEPMVQASVTYTLAPALVLTPAWSNGNRTLTLSHGTPFTTCTVYTFRVTAGRDVDENFSLQPGPVANPFKFMPTCPNPFIVFTIPANGATAVNATSNITVVFSEPMVTASVTFSIVPADVLTATWNPQSIILTLTPTTPYLCGVNTVQILTGTDQGDNLPLITGFVPNPWTFTPDCPNPYVASTDPADGATGVALASNVIITFNKPMDVASVTWNAVPAFTFSSSAWTANNTVLTLGHTTPFAQSTQYVMVVNGNDATGHAMIAGPVPNPWRFTTVALAPYIVTTQPANGDVNVLNGANVIVTFSQPMDNTTVVATPNPFILLAYTWSGNNTVVTLSHSNTFADCTLYTFTVSGQDTSGTSLGPGPVPNPWSFTTACVAPSIVNTNPTSGATGVPTGAAIWVNFSKPMNPVTVSAVGAPPVVFTYSWTNGDQTLEMTHGTPFSDCTMYTITVSGQDTGGNNLIPGPVPNPWSFTTACPSPDITSTVPANGATNVPTTFTITVTFSLAMNRTATTWTIVPAATGTTTPTWAGGDTILTLSFSQLQSECTLYQVTIAGQGANGQPLVSGPVPNPWSFSTVCTVGTPAGLAVTKTGSAVHLSWRAALNADYYFVFSSPSKTAAWPWPVLANVTTTTYDAIPHLADGNTHYYIVRAVRGTTESLNSTMGVKIQMNPQFSATSTNVWWFSLPYRTTYARASDIVAELGPANTKIDVVAKWNPLTQSSLEYVYFRGQWRGSDFTINPGDGLWIGLRSTFPWVIVGTDAAQTLTFTVNPAPQTNKNWVSVPYTGTYATASDIVRDIEGGIGPGTNTKITVVAKWNPATQSDLLYSYVAGVGWTGSNFAVNPGDGIYFRIVASFTWQPRLVTPEVP